MNRNIAGLAIVGLICLAVVSFLSSMADDRDEKPASASPSPSGMATYRSPNSGGGGSVPQPENRPPVQPTESETRRLLILYKEKFAGSGLKGLESLDEIETRGLERTPENLKSIRDLLKANITNDEKAVLTRILAGLYSRYDAQGNRGSRADPWNAEILGDLRTLATTPGNADAGGAAAVAYSRLGYSPDLLSVLSDAKTLGYINNNDYYGEVAHLLGFAPPDAQMQFLDQLRLGGNAYSLDILASQLQTQEQLRAFLPGALAAIKSILAQYPPKFPPEADRLDLIGAFQYADWLQTMALLDSSGNASNYDRFLLDHLNREKADPREIISFLFSDDGAQLIKRAGRSGLLNAAQNRIEAYAAQNAENRVIYDAVLEIETKLKAESPKLQ